jgi:Uma2 family endonuclease
MVVPDKSKLHTVDEFETYIARPENSDRYFELINGEIVEKVPTERHGHVSVNITTDVRIWIRKTGKGRIVVEVRHQNPDDRYNARQPDISYYADASRPIVEKGAVPQLPDLAIEIKSPDDTYKKLREKADYYLANGTKVVWLIYPDKQMVEVLTQDDFQILRAGETLDGGDLLPGFTMKVDDIFAD